MRALSCIYQNCESLLSTAQLWTFSMLLYSLHSLLTRLEKFRLTQKIFKQRLSLLLSNIHRGIPQGSGLGCPACLTLPLIHNRPGVMILKMDDVLNFVRIYSSVCLYLDFSLYKTVLYIFLRMRPSVWFGLHVEIKCNEPVIAVILDIYCCSAMLIKSATSPRELTFANISIPSICFISRGSGGTFHLDLWGRQVSFIFPEKVKSVLWQKKGTGETAKSL